MYHYKLPLGRLFNTGNTRINGTIDNQNRDDFKKLHKKIKKQTKEIASLKSLNLEILQHVRSGADTNLARSESQENQTYGFDNSNSAHSSVI